MATGARSRFQSNSNPPPPKRKKEKKEKVLVCLIQKAKLSILHIILYFELE